MATNFLINSPGLSTTGTDAAELYLVQSAAVSATTIVAKAGNDTIDLLGGTTNGDNVSLKTEGGADLITVSSTIFNGKSVFAGGAGADTVKFHAGGSQGAINLGDGSDLLFGTAAFELNTVTFGAGADRITAAVAVSAENARIGMGSGKDTVTFIQGGRFFSAEIKGGGGADVIALSAGLEANTTAVSLIGGAGGDTISFGISAEEVVVLGGNGSDVITQTANELQLSSQVLGGAGADNITMFSISGGGGNVVVGGGAGKDTISFAIAAHDGADVSIIGGGGNDSINLGVSTLTLGATTAGTVFGGAGADSITFSSEVDSGVALATQIGITKFSDSTLSATDVVTYAHTGADASGGVTLDFVTDGLGTNLVSGGTLVNNSVTIGASIVTNFTSTLTDLTARVAAIDALATTKGTVVAFMEDGTDAGSAAYLFIQGGAVDTLIEINEATALSGITTVATTNSAVSLTFDVT